MAKNSESGPRLVRDAAIAEGKIKHGGLKPISTSPRPIVPPQGKSSSTKSK
jgi:hypothetical protein